MKLSEIVSAVPGLAIYAEVALVLFLLAFAAVVIQVVSRSHAREWDEASSLPLEDPERTSSSR